MSIIERIYEKLYEQHKKPADLAKFLGVTNSQMSAWKIRNTDPPAKYLTSIAEFLGVSLNHLLTGTDINHEILRDRSYNFKFPAIFAGLLKDRDLSSYAIAKDIGVSQSTIKNWIDGVTFPDTQKLYEICKYFGVSADYLIGFSDRPGSFEISEEKMNALEEHAKTTPAVQVSMEELVAKLPPDMREPFMALYELAVYKYEQQNKE